MHPAVIEGREALCSLLGYAEEILKTGERVISDLGHDAVFALHEQEVSRLEGVTAPDGENWLRWTRLREVSAPEPDAEYRPWLGAQSGSGPFDPPRLADSHLVAVSIEEASDLIEAGLAAPDDVMAPRGNRRGRVDTVDVLLRLANMPEFAARFAEWVKGPWTAWAESEKPRRRSIAVYNQLFDVQQRMLAMGEDVPVEAVFGVGLARWQHPAGRINAPLIEATVELDLDPDGAIVVRPREQAPVLVLRAFDLIEIEGVGRLDKDASAQLQTLHADPDIGFSPFERASFESVLRMCHARLSATAVYEPDAGREGNDRTPPRTDATLRISDTWVLYVRQRSVNFRCDDIRRLADQIRDAEDEAPLPAPALRLASRPTDSRIDDDVIDLSAGISERVDSLCLEASSQPHAVGHGNCTQREEPAFFFPLPYNDEQIEIVRRLEQDAICGVVVQGPPGTGKTHTIANIIAHYMATGRRVLVSAHGPEALAALQQKLPESIRDLAISVIHSDREGALKLQQAIEILASQVKGIDRRAYNERRIELERALADTRAALSDLEEKVKEHADLNLAEVEYRSERLVPMELAARIEADRLQHAWFPDELDTTLRFEPRFSAADIAEAGRIRADLGRDLIYTAEQLPDPDFLPEATQLIATHQALIRDGAIRARAASGHLPCVSVAQGDGLLEARSLRSWLESLSAWAADIAADAWIGDFYRIVAGAKPVHDSVREELRALSGEWSDLHRTGRPLMFQSIELPEAAVPDPAFAAAIDALAHDRKAFGLLPFGKSVLKANIGAVRVNGAPPEGAEAWAAVREYLRWRRRAQNFISRWSAAAKSLGFPVIEGGWSSVSFEFLRLGDLIERMHQFGAEAARQAETVAALMPQGIASQQVVFRFDTALALEALGAVLDQEGFSDARALRRRFEKLGRAETLPFNAAVQAIGDALGDPDVSLQSLLESWLSVAREGARLRDLRVKRERLEAIAGRVRESGATKWAAALLVEFSESGGDPWTQAGWPATWEWARAAGFVRRISDRASLATLAARRTALENRQRELLAEIVRLRTFIGLKQAITERIAAALTRFAMTMRQLGTGKGKAAGRRLRAIREAMSEAAGAVPCWILPEWRVAEQLPSQLAAFDLVVIDEASQSDITALPTVLRGKKLLIVGDDKQVSPMAVGMEERTIVQLRETFLRGMDLANFLEPTTSLYDLASAAFPGGTIMLREHFRCVEPIIRFSSRFYPKALHPLRIPTAAERLDPPLVDIYVPDGRKVYDVNKAEARVIVDEIAQLVAQPAFAGRTIGVISLIGDKQAKLIQDQLTKAAGPEAMARHRIMCGNASTFQGQERDIMFLSMVACPLTVRAQTARIMEQRFNVAMSRARDRMYLVRSVAASMLSPNDLKSAVIEHFRNPMAGVAVAQSGHVLDACESPFEREFGECLLKRGYRLRAQVPAGAFRIDFVVEGEGDRRLAIELDGDRYHGPARWAEDQRRQRALERIGWMFWRCWGSHWLSDRQGCLDDLLATLARLGIEPVGCEYSPTVFTEHRVAGEAAGGAEAAQAPQRAAATAGESAPDIDPAGNADLFEPGPAAAAEENSSAVVEEGDTVRVRYADDNRVRQFRLSREANNLDGGIVHIGQPIGRALLGNALDEEIEFLVGGQARRVVIEKITKAA